MRLGIMSFAHMHAYSYASVIKPLPGVQLVGVADANPDRGRRGQAVNTRYFTSFDELRKAI